MTIPPITIRDEQPRDFPAITNVTVSAFASLEISDKTEQFVIQALRAENALTISLVAEANERLVGHIAFSPVTMSDGTSDWYGLGPVSVLPEFQSRGIGTSLINEGISRLKNLKANGCCLVGHPHYYPRFGFRNVDELVYDGAPASVFFVLPFNTSVPTGKVYFHHGFSARR